MLEIVVDETYQQWLVSAETLFALHLHQNHHTLQKGDDIVPLLHHLLMVRRAFGNRLGHRAYANLKIGIGNQVVIGAKVNTIKEFLSHIKQTKPDWYVPEKLVAKQLIQEKYEELYGPVSYKKFHNMFYKKYLVIV